MLPQELADALVFDRMPPCDPAAAPQVAQVIFNSDLLRIATELGMDLSAICSAALEEEVRRVLYAQWHQQQA